MNFPKSEKFTLGQWKTSDFSDHPALLKLSPSSESELIGMVMDLNRQNRSFHVVSRGQNWGYGDQNLNENCDTLIHLEKMDRIVHFDATLGTVTIEPGVSQGQLSQFLERAEGGKDWRLDVTGANPEASVVGNFLERGFGHSSYGDHEAHGKILRGITASGEVFTPHQSFNAGSTTRGLYQHDTGLNFEKLFYQTNFLIATEFLVHLRPTPKVKKFAFILIKTDRHAAEALAKIGDLKMRQILASVPHMANRERIRRSTNEGKQSKEAWVLTVDISGEGRLVQLRKRYLKKYFKDSEVKILSERTILWLERLKNHLPATSQFREQLQNLLQMKDLFLGKPRSEFVANSLQESAEGPRRIRWICPLLPNQTNDFNLVQQVIQKISKKHEITVGITVSMLSERCSAWVSEIVVPRTSAEMLARAEGFYFECERTLAAMGYPFYRYGLNSGNGLYKDQDQVKQLYSKIKLIFDPKNLLSPGRWGA